jgi:hypothetical protein
MEVPPDGQRSREPADGQAGLCPADAAARLAKLTRQLAGRWCGVDIAVPYLPQPVTGGGDPFWPRFGRLLTDQATWRDLLWMTVDCSAGWVLTLVPAALVVFGLFGVVTPAEWHSSSWYAMIHLTSTITASRNSARASGPPDLAELRGQRGQGMPAWTREPRHARPHPAAAPSWHTPELCLAAAAPRTMRCPMPGGGPQTETMAITQGQLPHNAESPPVAPIDAEYGRLTTMPSREDDAHRSADSGRPYHPAGWPSKPR